MYTSECPPTRASCQSPLASHPFPNAREAPGSSTVGHPCALPQHLHQPRNPFPQTLSSPRTGRQHKHLPVARTHRSSALPNPKCCRRFILRYRVTFVHEDQQGRSDQGVVSEHAFERQASISKCSVCCRHACICHVHHCVCDCIVAVPDRPQPALSPRSHNTRLAPCTSKRAMFSPTVGTI